MWLKLLQARGVVTNTKRIVITILESSFSRCPPRAFRKKAKTAINLPNSRIQLFSHFTKCPAVCFLPIRLFQTRPTPSDPRLAASPAADVTCTGLRRWGSGFDLTDSSQAPSATCQHPGTPKLLGRLNLWFPLPSGRKPGRREAQPWGAEAP